MASSAARLKNQSSYPEPFIVPPASDTHNQTFIILHGRGSNGTKFGEELLRTPIPAFGSLQSAFPNAKFVFPTAAKRRAQIYKRTPINQWFDNWSLETPTDREESQFDGLRESATYVNELVGLEVARVGVGNVVLWGLSQGCAAVIISALLWRWDGLGAVVGMCGWLPLRKRMEDVVEDEEGGDDDDDDDPFSRSAELSGEAKSKMQNVVEYLQEELEMSDVASSSGSALKIPVFLGHGSEDERVSVKLGREAAGLLRSLEVGVEWMEYDGLGHWYCGKMLQDILSFIQRSAGFEIVHEAARPRLGLGNE